VVIIAAAVGLVRRDHRRQAVDAVRTCLPGVRCGVRRSR
jgi:hypothetical protein